MAAGENAYWSDLAAISGAIVGRGRRTTPTAGFTTTETPALRVDNIPVIVGHAYQVLTGSLNLDTSVDNDVAEARFRVAVSASTGVFATIAHLLVGRSRNVIDSNVQSNMIPAQVFYFPPSTGYLSVLLSGVRAAGTGTIVLFASASDPIDMIIKDLGPDPGNTGVVL